MVRGATGFLRARRWAAAGLLALGALLIVRPMVADLSDPAWPEPDGYQVQLDGWARVLAPIDAHVPAGEALLYACARDERGRRLADLDASFDFIQAVLAPRRVGRTLESRFVLAHFRADEGQSLPELGDARVLAELAKGLVLVERAGP